MPVKPRTSLVTSALCVLLSSSLAASQGGGRLRCETYENGARAPGSFRLLRGSAQIASGACGRDADVPAGELEVALTLDGVLAAAERRVGVSVRPGQTARAEARFETGVLLVEATREGRRAAAHVQLLRGTDAVARLSAGVESRVAVGSYAVEVESRGERRRVDGVTIARGERRVVGVELAGAPK